MHNIYLTDQLTIYLFSIEYGKTAARALCIHATLLVCVWQENAQKYTTTTEARGREGAYITSCRCQIPFSLESAFQNTSFFGKPLFDFETLHLRMVCTTCSFPQTHAKHFSDCGMTWQSKSPLPKRRLHWQKLNLPTRALGRDRPAQTIFKRFRLFFFHGKWTSLRLWSCDNVFPQKSPPNVLKA